MTDTKLLKLVVTKRVNIKWLIIYSKKKDVDYALQCYNSECNADDALTKEEFCELLKTVKRWRK